jgi:hypothetical protein
VFRYIKVLDIMMGIIQYIKVLDIMMGGIQHHAYQPALKA